MSGMARNTAMKAAVSPRSTLKRDVRSSASSSPRTKPEAMAVTANSTLMARPPSAPDGKGPTSRNLNT